MRLPIAVIRRSVNEFYRVQVVGLRSDVWGAPFVHAKGFAPNAHQNAPPVHNHNLDYAKWTRLMH
jgi:hypothetical protein